MFIYKMLYYIFPGLMTWLTIHVLSAYLRHYDIGVNAAGSDGFLIFFIAPALFIFLYGVAWLTLFIFKFFKKKDALAMTLGGVHCVLFSMLAFFLYLQTVKDYPTEKPQEPMLFLKNYVLGS